MIPFNVPPFVGTETKYIEDAIAKHKICGDGEYTKKCNAWLEEKTGAPKVLLTTSCTHATEMAALLCDIKLGDEVTPADEQELVSPVAHGAGVLAACCTQDDVGSVLQCAVTNLVATLIVDALHVVHVHKDELGAVEIAQQMLVGNRAKALETKAVEEPRKLIAHIQIVEPGIDRPQLLLLAHALDGA